MEDGANQTLNRLVEYVEKQGAHVRVISPTSKTPAFAPSGTLISVPSIPLPLRPEYRLALGLPRAVKMLLAEFRPNVIHLSTPDWLGYSALCLSKRWCIPTVASVHTRFESYPEHYGLGFLEKRLRAYLSSFYRQCQHVYAPSESYALMMCNEGMGRDVGVWSRGVDRELFHPKKRDMAWRRSCGIRDEEVVITLVSRLVLEKGLDVFVRSLCGLASRGISHRVMIVGKGPERDRLSRRLPHAVFTGFLVKEELARAYASSDIFFFPSATETFGNVTLEAMASGIPAVCSDATGSNVLVCHGVTGFLANASNIEEFIGYLTRLTQSASLRSTMGLASRKRSGEFCWERVMKSMYDKFMEIISEAYNSPSRVYAIRNGR